MTATTTTVTGIIRGVVRERPSAAGNPCYRITLQVAGAAFTCRTAPNASVAYEVTPLAGGWRDGQTVTLMLDGRGRVIDAELGR